jgi:HAD superfamily phosphoserine phosphatase-like hydrolase
VPTFASVVIDVDSTLCGVEGIDFLAERRGPDVGRRIVELTDLAMKGEIPLESVYSERLTIVRPGLEDIRALATAYMESVAPGAPEAIATMRAAGARLALVSGGILQAILPVARELGFGADEVHAVSLRFASDGSYAAIDEPAPLATQRGKPDVVSRLLETGRLVRPLLAVGDGATDAMLVGVADQFAAFTGFARRESVVARADLETRSFDELKRQVLGLGARG